MRRTCFASVAAGRSADRARTRSAPARVPSVAYRARRPMRSSSRVFAAMWRTRCPKRFAVWVTRTATVPSAYPNPRRSPQSYSSAPWSLATWTRCQTLRTCTITERASSWTRRRRRSCGAWPRIGATRPRSKTWRSCTSTLDDSRRPSVSTSGPRNKGFPTRNTASPSASNKVRARRSTSPKPNAGIGKGLIAERHSLGTTSRAY
mmetsp:Transcript_28941/g.94724  ORF Transcript_28941/g.94724 Transcript_28941/m.94724 type:complete len:205 (+) Transcript_28941:62-676(+)